MTEKPYRKNVAVIVTDGYGKVLLCRRLGRMPFVQTVQGGVDEGESHRAAAVRELHEELGLTSEQAEIIAECPTMSRYDFVPPLSEDPRLDMYRGQEQTFFLAKVDPNAEFDLTSHGEQEFEKVWWGTPEEFVAEAWELKRPGIEMALRSFGLLS